MLALEGKCTCPDPASAPYPGHVFNGADPAHVACLKRYRIKQARYERKRAACKACPQWKLEHEALLGELGISLKPWESDIYDRPGVVAALEAVESGGPNGQSGQMDQPHELIERAQPEPPSGAKVMFLVRGTGKPE